MTSTRMTFTRMRLLVSLVTAFALVWSCAFPAGVAFGDEIVIEEEQTTNDEAQIVVVESEENATERVEAVVQEKNKSEETIVQTTGDPVDTIVAGMSLDEKISQMIIPAMRTWGGSALTTLDPDSALATALRKHQYGGIILFRENVVGVEQTGNLVNALQQNNMGVQDRSKNIPYLMCVDGEGGAVVRFVMGTRMTGSMAVGATGDRATANAQTTGRVLGEEIAALGFAVDLAPDIDVNNNPANPVIGTRSFGDDAQTVGSLGEAFTNGLSQSDVIATYKHFPGHGNTATDSHIGTPSVNRTLEQLNACELVPFRHAVNNGAELIMTAHITLPNYDEQVEFADGTKGNYPATMSSKVIGELLRGDLGYQGVVITDALEMDALYEHQLVAAGTNAPAGETASQRKARLMADPVYCANLAEKIILAGGDILLVPTDLMSDDAVAFYDEYIDAIANKAESSTSMMARIDQSVARILRLKQRHGILDTYQQVDVQAASAVVGSEEHHEAEMQIAREAITLVKNDDHTLPISGHENNVVIMGRLKTDNKTIQASIESLKDMGILAEDAYVNNLAAGTTSGDASSKTHVTIDYYYDSGKGVAHYTNALKSAIANANTVVCCTASYNIGPLAGSSPLYQCVSRAMRETHAAGGKFVLLANNLPYDVARYQDVDAAMLGYMVAGIDSDPTDKHAGGVAYNANVMAALHAMFDDVEPGGPIGTLPVNIPSVCENDDLTISYNDDTLYARAFGLTYDYAFVKGAGGTHTKGTGQALSFTCNARLDRLQKVLVDGKELGRGDCSTSAGSTNVTLAAAYLDTLTAGKHTLVAAYDYGAGAFTVSTTFQVAEAPVVPKETKPSVSYKAHVQNKGWRKTKKNGAIGGSVGKSLRLEALRVSVANLPCSGGIRYRTYVQGKGWERGWSMDGETSGTVGKARRVEAVRIKLYGELAKRYNVYYRVHVEGYGWMAWAKNGKKAGTQGMSRRVEAIQIVLVKKGSKAPGKTFKGAKQTYRKAFRKR